MVVLHEIQKKMKKTLLILIIVMLPSISLAEERMVIRFAKPGKAILAEFLTEKYDVAAYKPGDFLDVVVTKAKYRNILARGLGAWSTQTQKRLKSNLRGKTLGAVPAYRNYESMLAELQQIEADYPEICKLYDVGDSWGKWYSGPYYDGYRHDIWAMKVSDNVETNEDEPCVYYMGEHHAREPISLEVVMAVLRHIVDNYGSDPTVTHNVDNTQIWFIPLVNPNGHKVVIDEIDTWWRKNIRDNNDNGVFDTDNTTGSGMDGVDLNRNYSFMWGEGSDDWNSVTYQGPEASSEPETQAMRDLLAANHFVAGISYHSYGELVLFPYSYDYLAYAPDSNALEELATEMAVTIPARNGGHYTPKAAWMLYPATGTTDDYAYGVHGAFAFTIELGTEFIPPADDIEGICQDNIEAAMILLDRVNHSTLYGHVTDSETHEPVAAKVFITGVDDTGEYRLPYMSNGQFGTYYRMVQAGNYDVSFVACGYETATFEGIVVTKDGRTILDVALNPMAEPVVDVKANGSDGPLYVLSSTLVSVDITLDSAGYDGQNATWWMVADTPCSYYSYVYPKTWVKGFYPYYHYPYPSPPLMALSHQALRRYLVPGSYTFYFAVSVDESPSDNACGLRTWVDSVEVHVGGN